MDDLSPREKEPNELSLLEEEHAQEVFEEIDGLLRRHNFVYAIVDDLKNVGEGSDNVEEDPDNVEQVPDNVEQVPDNVEQVPLLQLFSTGFLNIRRVEMIPIITVSGVYWGEPDRDPELFTYEIGDDPIFKGVIQAPSGKDIFFISQTIGTRRSTLIIGDRDSIDQYCETVSLRLGANLVSGYIFHEFQELVELPSEPGGAP